MDCSCSAHTRTNPYSRDHLNKARAVEATNTTRQVQREVGDACVVLKKHVEREQKFVEAELRVRED